MQIVECCKTRFQSENCLDISPLIPKDLWPINILVHLQTTVKYTKRSTMSCASAKVRQISRTWYSLVSAFTVEDLHEATGKDPSTITVPAVEATVSCCAIFAPLSPKLF